MDTQVKSGLALLGGEKAVKSDFGDTFVWPIVTKEDEDAVLEVLRRGGMSGTDVTQKLEAEFARWQGRKYALGFNNGTSSIQAAMFGCGVGVGAEIICPSVTYWASALQCFSLGGTVVFADIDPQTLCIDPKDIEHRITDRTRAIVVVHYLGHPADMDPIMEIARRHNIKVIEDVSHAQGALYKGRKVGTFGDVAAMSCMSGKSFAIGEAGMLATDNLEIYERAISMGHYKRFGEQIQTESLKPFVGLPMGGYKYRMHQLSSAMGLVQLKYYDERCAEIRRGMDYFWELLEGVPGLRPHRPEYPESNMGGYYAPHGHYLPEELDGLSVSRFAEAVRAEGFAGCYAGCNSALHLHPLFNTCDVYGHGKPTRIANSDRDLRQPEGSLPVSEGIGARTYSVPWFNRYNPTVIEECASAFRKAAENYKELLPGDKGNPPHLGGWHFFSHG
jgi:dTDP-4-amino-4,6-dideoxygalactose transaminase